MLSNAGSIFNLVAGFRGTAAVLITTGSRCGGQTDKTAGAVCNVYAGGNFAIVGYVKKSEKGVKSALGSSLQWDRPRVQHESRAESKGVRFALGSCLTMVPSPDTST